MKIGTGAVAVAIAVVLAACGSSAKTSSSASAVAVSSTTSSTTSTTTPAPAKKKKAAVPKKKHKAATHTQTTTTSTTTTAPTTSTTTTTHRTTTTHTTPALAPLPSPYVSGSSGQMRAELHAVNHTPKIGVGWAYAVEATNAQGQPLTGTVAAQFLYNGTVVGHQSPPSFPLKDGKMSYGKDVFPPASKGIALTFQVVVKTPLGTVKLNWPVRSHT